MHRTIRAAIFDMDGTIYDTERVYRLAWLAAGVPEELYRTFIGTPRAHIKKALEENGFDPEKIYVRKDEYTAKALEKEIPLKPGAVECLSWLRANGIKTAIATSSSIEVAQKYLVRTGLAEKFDVVVSGNQVPNGKPAPDVFLLAAEQLGAAVQECVVLEDSYNGVRAGYHAGMLTVMIPDLIPADDEMREKADYVVASLGEVPGLLASLTA